MPHATIDQHLAEAGRARSAGRLDELRRHCAAVLELDDAEPTARNYLGADALARGDAQSAAEHFEIACAREPGEAAHWINLAAARRALGEPSAERQALEAALAIDQTNLLALIRLAELHERQGEEAAAAERWSAVVVLGSRLPGPSPELVQLLAHARAFVERQRARLADAVDRALADDLARASPRDRRRARAAADHWLGRRAIYTNQCEGLHYPFLPADEYFDRELFPWFDRLEAATGEIVAELETLLSACDPGVQPYIAQPPGTPRNKWSPLDRSLDWGAFHLWKEGVRDEEACARVPRTAALVEQLPICRIPGRAPNVFFSILKAGSHIPPHTGVTNVRSVVHLPLIVPQGCGFRVGGETREWRVGEAFAFDDTIEHEAWNRGDKDRALLILDCWNPHLSEDERALVCQIYAAADSERGALG